MPSGSGCCPPASLPPVGSDGPVWSPLALFWYLLNPLFCEQARWRLRLELFAGKFSVLFFFFSLSGYPTVWVAISHLLPQIVLRALRPGPYPKHAAHASLSSPCLLVADGSVWATSPLGVVVRHIYCGGFFLLLLLPVMLPSEIPKLPTDPP